MGIGHESRQNFCSGLIPDHNGDRSIAHAGIAKDPGIRLEMAIHEKGEYA